MRMTLSARASGAATGPVPPPLTLDRRSASIGRAPECDLVLPDPRNLISRRHAQVDFDGAGYILNDISTSGTAVNGQRIAKPHRLAAGDVIGIGGFQIVVAMGQAGVGAGDGRDLRPSVAAAVPPGMAAPGADAVTQLLAAAGLPRAAVPVPDAAVLAASGVLLRQMAASLIALLAARTRARAELRVPTEANAARNPFLAAVAPEAVLSEVLRSGAAGAGPAAAAAQALIETHQRATLAAMQGALARTLDAFAPTAIRERTKGGDAAYWRAYEAAFAGQAGEADFLETFARELSAAYAAADAAT